MAFLYLIVVGAIIGWIAGKILKGGGYGLIGNIILGIAGAVVGGFISNLLNFSFGSGFISQIVTGVIGAIFVMWIIGVLRKKK